LSWIADSVHSIQNVFLRRSVITSATAEHFWLFGYSILHLVDTAQEIIL